MLSTNQTPYGSAEDVNDHGTVIGISFLPDGDQHATVWRADQQRGTDLGVLPGGTYASLVDIDNAGAAVGGGNLAGHLHKTHAIYWPGSGGLQLLRPLSGHLYGDFAVARNLDTHGNAVGASTDATGEIRGTGWKCAAAQAVTPRPTADVGTSRSTAVRLAAGLTRGRRHAGRARAPPALRAADGRRHRPVPRRSARPARSPRWRCRAGADRRAGGHRRRGGMRHRPLDHRP